MQNVKEIQFVIYDDETSTTEEEQSSSVASSEYAEAFSKIEGFLQDLDITPEIAEIKRSDNQMIVTLSPDLPNEFNISHAIIILGKLDECFRVTYLEFNSEYDDWYEDDPHILYGFYVTK